MLSILLRLDTQAGAFCFVPQFCAIGWVDSWQPASYSTWEARLTAELLGHAGVRYCGAFPRVSTRKFVPCQPLWNLLSWTGSLANTGIDVSITEV